MLQFLLLVGWVLSVIHGFAVVPSDQSTQTWRFPHRDNDLRRPSFFTYTTSSALELFRSKSGGTGTEIVQVESHADWMELLHAHEEDEETGTSDQQQQQQVIAVTFTAGWCKFCQKFQRIWKRKLVQPHHEEVRFASVEYGANRQLCQSLQIQALPTVQFYTTHGDLINSFACGPKGFSSAKERLHTYMAMTTEQLAKEVSAFAKKQKEQATKNKDGKKKSSSKVTTTVDRPIEIPDDDDDHFAEADDEEHHLAMNTTDDKDNTVLDEPSLYLRKRDRFKRKLRGGRYRGN